jgi:hypothetical protein
MILNNKLRKPPQHMRSFLLRNLIDLLRMMTYSEYALPTRHRVRPDDGMHSRQIRASISRVAALAAVELETVLLRALVEDRLLACHGQRLEKFAVGGRDAVVEFVARRPERITSSLRKLSQAQDSVVRGYRLESDIAVPAVFVALLRAPERGAVFVELLCLLGGDDRDLIVVATEATAAVGDRVDVEAGLLGFAGELAEFLDELFLEVVVEVVLFAEEDYAALGDWTG